jgi:acetylglutamate kinase
MDIVQMVLCGKVNKDLCAMLKGKGVGLSGLDGSLFLAKRHTDSAETDFGRVGDIELVHPEIVTTMLDQGYIPVISSVALDMDDEKSCNINADTAASKIAAALHAKKLILLTDVPGLMMDPKDPETLLKTVKVSSVPALVSQNVIKGGMIPKVECCVEAIRQGVESATIQDGRLEHSILMELLSNDGIGTMFC